MSAGWRDDQNIFSYFNFFFPIFLLKITGFLLFLTIFSIY
jgi:hypothetical protein